MARTDYDVVKADLAVSGGTEVADGNDAAWRELFELAQDLADNPSGNANNYWTMQGLNADGTRNQSLPVLLDVENLADYMLAISQNRQTRTTSRWILRSTASGSRPR